MPKMWLQSQALFIKHDRVEHSLRWSPRELWEQVAHVDPVVANPTVSEFTRRSARREIIKRFDGKCFTKQTE